MKEGVPEMSNANVGGGSCEIFRAAGVFVNMHHYFNCPTTSGGPPLLFPSRQRRAAVKDGEWNFSLSFPFFMKEGDGAERNDVLAKKNCRLFLTF